MTALPASSALPASAPVPSRTRRTRPRTAAGAARPGQPKHYLETVSRTVHPSHQAPATQANAGQAGAPPYDGQARGGARARGAPNTPPPAAMSATAACSASLVRASSGAARRSTPGSPPWPTTCAGGRGRASAAAPGQRVAAPSVAPPARLLCTAAGGPPLHPQGATACPGNALKALKLTNCPAQGRAGPQGHAMNRTCSLSCTPSSSSRPPTTAAAATPPASSSGLNSPRLPARPAAAFAHSG